MEDLHSLLVARRSIRQYTAEPLESEAVKMILEAALLSPTGKNSRAWHFVCVEEREMLQQLSQCKAAGASSVGRSALSVVVCVDTTATETWVEDGSIAAAYMMLQATDLGIGSCWIEVNGRYAADGTPADEVVKELLGIPEEIQPLCIVTFGYPTEERKPQNCDKLLWERVHIGKFNGACSE